MRKGDGDQFGRKGKSGLGRRRETQINANVGAVFYWSYQC